MYTGWIAPRVGVGFERIGRDADAVRLSDTGDLLGFGFGVDLGGGGVATVVEWAKRLVRTVTREAGRLRFQAGADAVRKNARFILGVLTVRLERGRDETEWRE